MARDDLFFRIRLPEALKNEIQRLAVGNHRSANAEIVARLSESIALGLNGGPLSTDGSQQPVDEIEQVEGETFAERLSNLEGKRKQLMVDGLREMLKVLDAGNEPPPTTAKKKAPSKTRV